MTTDLKLVTKIQSAASAGERPLILFLPGLSGNNGQWDAVVRSLEEAPVRLAFGAPILSHPALLGGRPTVVQLGKAMAAELRADHGNPVIIVTHSVGAFTALAIAREAPDLIKSIVIINGGLTSVARFIDSPVRQLIMHPSSSLAYMRLFVLVGAPVPGKIKRAIASRRWSSRALLGNLVSDAALESREQRNSLMAEAGKSETVLALWKNRHHWHDFEGYAHAVEAKVHFIVGDKDPMTTEQDTRLMAGLLPQSRVTVLKGIGHAAPLEATQEVVEAIMAELEA